MTVLRVAAVQASYTLMDRDATIDRVAALTADAAARGADLIVFPEVFVPGTPIWIDTRPVWDGDDDWFGLLADNAVVVPGPASERLAAIAAGHHVWLVVGIDERKVAIQRRHIDPVGHYNRPDIFRLHADTAPRPPVIVDPAPVTPQNRTEEHHEQHTPDQRIRG